MIKTKQDATDYINQKCSGRWETEFDAGEENTEEFFKVNQGGSRVLRNGISVSSFSKLVDYVYKNRKYFN